MDTIICKALSFLILSLMFAVSVLANSEAELVSLIEKEGSSFYFGKGKIPNIHHASTFGPDKLAVLLSETSEKPKHYFSQMHNYKAYACTHINHFKEGVSSEIHRAMAIPQKLTSGSDPIRWAMDRLSSHLTSPAGKPILGRLTSYIYQLDDSGKLVGTKNFDDDEVGLAIAPGKTVLVKYCLDLPFFAVKCNTVEHKVVKFNANTEVLYSVLVDPKTRLDEGAFFKDENMKKNTNDSGSGMVVIQKIGNNVVYVETSKFISSQKNTVSEFKMFDKKISKDQCEKNSLLLAKRFGVTEVNWAELF